MARDDVRRAVLDAITRGDIPVGGPSELAAYDLLGDVPAGYLEKWAGEAAERVRARPPCSCVIGVDVGSAAHCRRCSGLVAA